MIYLLLIPISLVFGTCFFLLGRISRYPSKEYECRPEMMYFKDGNRIFPNHETISAQSRTGF